MGNEREGEQPTKMLGDKTTWRKLDGLTWADLEADAPIDDKDTSLADKSSREPILSSYDTPAGRFQRAQAAEQEQKNSFRGILFWCILVACGIGYLLTAIMVIVFLSNHPETPVMVGWISAGVVQLVGLTYIVARYVFPSSTK